MIKRHVVRAILRDIFRIMSDGIYFSSLTIYFSSHAILNTSDGILFPTYEIGGNSESFWEKLGENQDKVGECREKFENSSQICRRNDFEPT